MLAHALHGDVVLVVDVADDLLDDVLERDEAEHDAIFVDHQRRMGLAAQERLQLIAATGGVGDEPGVERDVGGAQLRHVAARGGIGAEQVLDVQDADDVVGIAAPKRHAGIGRGERLAHKIGRRQIGVERAHLGAVDHHVADRHFGEFEQAAEHVALIARNFALAMQHVDGAAQFLGAGEPVVAVGEAEADTAAISRTNASTACTTGPKTVTKNATTGAIASETRSG